MENVIIHIMLLPKAANRGFLFDRRRRKRLRLACRVLLYRDMEPFGTEATIIDISCEGFFCVTDRVFHCGEKLECNLVIPGDNQGSRPDEIFLRCRADIVRVVPRTSTSLGIACKLADYTVARENLQPWLEQAT